MTSPRQPKRPKRVILQNEPTESGRPAEKDSMGISWAHSEQQTAMKNLTIVRDCDDNHIVVDQFNASPKMPGPTLLETVARLED